MNKELIRFQASIIKAAGEFSGSVPGRDAQEWVEALFAEYSSQSATDLASWLKARLASEFRFVSEPPKWVEEEPAWPFYSGRPMVFVSQFSLPDNPVTRAAVTWGATLYLFAARVEQGPGYRLHFHVVTQIPGIDGVGER